MYSVRIDPAMLDQMVASQAPSANWGQTGVWKNASDDALKRAFDICVATVLLIAMAPLMALVALAIRVDSPGPVIFRQKRYGLGGQIIEVCKFRTMIHARTDHQGARQATRDDDRITRIGRFLRKTCLDELPQIWDVLSGRMSLVGPRPHPVGMTIEGELAERLIPDYMARLAVRPGITGLAQVNGNRGPIHDVRTGELRIAYDLVYIRNRSILSDFRILWMTLKVPFTAGSY